MVGLQPICLLYPTTLLWSIGFLSVGPCLHTLLLNIWRALLHRLLCSRILRICVVVLKTDWDSSFTTFPVYLALMAIFTGIFILTTILQKIRNLIKKREWDRNSLEFDSSSHSAQLSRGCKSWWNQRSRIHLNHCVLIDNQNNREARTFCSSLFFISRIDLFPSFFSCHNSIFMTDIELKTVSVSISPSDAKIKPKSWCF